MKNINLLLLFAILSITKFPNIHCAAIKTSDCQSLELEFLEATFHGNIAKVKDCIIKNVNVNAVDEYGRTALIYAACLNRIAITKMFFDEFGLRPLINFNAKDKMGRTALMWAVHENNIEIVKIILDYNQEAIDNCVNVNTVDVYAKTALIYALKKRFIDVINLLLQYKQNDPIQRLNVNAANNEGETALMVAAKEGHVEVVRLLLMLMRNEDGTIKEFRIDVNQGKRKI